MKLVYKKDYISIQRFDEVELPDFVVLTGMNGSGKSHLLEAIEKKHVAVEGMGTPRIVLFDYRNFYLENEAAYNARHIIDERNNAWNFLQSNAKNNLESFKNTLGTNYQTLSEIAKDKGKGLLELTKKDIQEESLYTQFQEYKKRVREYFNQEGFKNNQQAQAVYPVGFTSPYSLDQITRDYFDDVYKPYQFKNDFLPHQLGKVIWDYYLKYRNNEINEFQNEKHGKSYPVLTENEFEALHGKKPWEIVNSILDRFGTIEYRLPSPEGSDYYSDFQFRLEHPSKDLKVDFSALSSGEKVLMALVASIYKTSSDHHFPDILLLDEIDASLHPSMIKNLLETISDIFLVNSTKVIVVTHSPTTVALAPEESVYVMNKEGAKRIEKRSKNDALTILTEGFATLEEGLRIFDEIGKQDISIISEGGNADLIKKALELYGVNDVDVISGVEGSSGDTQLRTIFDFLCKIPHQKKVVIVWDPEVKYSFSAQNNTYPFIFPLNDANSLTQRGIENLFDEQLFEGFTTTFSDSRNKEKKAFDVTRKKDFAQSVIARNNKDDFAQFNSLISKISEIRGEST
jgi:predicted ATPase